MEAGDQGGGLMAAVVEGGLFCTLRTKRCLRVRSLSLSVTVALLGMTTRHPRSMVAPAHLMAWWQMAGRLVKAMVILVGQAAPGMRVDPGMRPIVEEAAVALEDQGMQVMVSRLVTAARAYNRTYLAPPIIMAAAAAAAAPEPGNLAMED